MKLFSTGDRVKLGRFNDGYLSHKLDEFIAGWGYILTFLHNDIADLRLNYL